MKIICMTAETLSSIKLNGDNIVVDVDETGTPLGPKAQKDYIIGLIAADAGKDKLTLVSVNSTLVNLIGTIHRVHYSDPIGDDGIDSVAKDIYDDSEVRIWHKDGSVRICEYNKYGHLIGWEHGLYSYLD